MLVTPKELIIPRPQYQAILHQLHTVYPQEGCGFLAGHCSPDGVGKVKHCYPVENVLHSEVAFAMHPALLVETILAIEAECLDLLAIYHSHPRSAAAPSATDIAQVYDPDVAQLIVSLEDVLRPRGRAFLIQDGQYREIPCTIL